jgi:hypothetical protein
MSVAMPTPDAKQTQLPPRQEIPNLGAVTHGGAIAYYADSLLRGFVQGRNMVNAQQAMKLKRKSDDLQNSYNQDAQRLYQLASAGIPQNSDAFKSAQSAVNGSWGALQDFRGQLIDQQEGGKKKKGKGKDGQQLPPAAVLSNPASTPQEKAQALHQVSMQAGPPVLAQVARFYTPQAQQQRTNQGTAQGLQTDELQARSTISKLGPQIAQIQNKPQDQWTDSEKSLVAQYKQAYGVVNPPKIEDPKPGDETKMALDEVVKRISQPGYKLTDADKDIFRANKINIDPKSKLHVTSRGEIIEEHDDGTYDIKRGVQKAYEPRGEGGASGGSMEKKFREDVNFLMNHHPGMTRAEAEAQAMPTVEGVAGTSRDIDAKNAKDDPDQFANDVTTVAVGKLRDLPQYKKMDDDTFDGAIASIVGRTNNDGEDAQYQYRQQSGKDQIQPDSKGMYSGNLDHKGLVRLEADLQNQIRDVLKSPNLRGLTSDELNAVKGRLKPLWVGNSSSAGSTVTPGSPQAGAATPAPASSPAQGGKSQFMAIPNPKGLREPGNIPIWDRPTVQNADGTHSSEYSTSFRDEKTGNEVLVPTVVNGKFLTPDGKKPREGSSEEKAMFQKAWQHYLQTGENLGKFDNPHDADSYANVLHNRGNQSGKGGKSDEPRERKIYQHGQLHGTIKLTDAEAKQLADDADFKAQGGTIK